MERQTLPPSLREGGQGYLCDHQPGAPQIRPGTISLFSPARDLRTAPAQCPPWVSASTCSGCRRPLPWSTSRGPGEHHQKIYLKRDRPDDPGIDGSLIDSWGFLVLSLIATALVTWTVLPVEAQEPDLDSLLSVMSTMVRLPAYNQSFECETALLPPDVGASCAAIDLLYSAPTPPPTPPGTNAACGDLCERPDLENPNTEMNWACGWTKAQEPGQADCPVAWGWPEKRVESLYIRYCGRGDCLRDYGYQYVTQGIIKNEMQPDIENNLHWYLTFETGSPRHNEPCEEFRGTYWGSQGITGKGRDDETGPQFHCGNEDKNGIWQVGCLCKP